MYLEGARKGKCISKGNTVWLRYNWLETSTRDSDKPNAMALVDKDAYARANTELLEKKVAICKLDAIPARNVSHVIKAHQSQDDCLSIAALQLQHSVCQVALDGNHGLEGKLQLIQSCAELTSVISADIGLRRSGS